MNKRVMIVVWKWELEKLPFMINNTNDIKATFACLDVKVKKSDDKFIIITKPYSTYKIEDTIAKYMDEYNIQLLLHRGTPDNFSAEKYSIVDIDNFRDREQIRDVEFILPNNIKVHLFSGEEPLIQKEILSQPVNCINKVKDGFEIKKENFDITWNYYFGDGIIESPADLEKKKIDLGQKKNELLQLWLPLAIDIQGLSEVSEHKFTSYLEDAKKDWDEILKKKFNFNKESSNLSFVEYHNAIIESIKEIDMQSFIINDKKIKELLNLKQIKDKKSDLLKKDNECFLPKFLKKLIRVIHIEIRNLNKDLKKK